VPWSRLSPSPIRFASILCVALVVFGPATIVAAVLTGTVTDPDQRPAPDVQIVLSGHADAPQTTTDAHGRFRFEDVRPGTYDLIAIRSGFRLDPTRIEVERDGGYDVELRLRLSAVTESIVVTASSADLSLSRTPSTVSVLTRADLEARQVETVADALRLVPGLGVVRSGGRGSLTAVFPRGGESDSTLVLVDGMRANDFGGGFDFAGLPVGEVERIEVVRGPQSALYGSDAIGAVVQIVTRHGGPARVDGSLEIGQDDMTRATIGASGSPAQFTWGAAAERFASNGFDGLAPATGERVVNDDHRLSNLSVSGGWHGGPETTVRGTVRLTSSERGFPGPFGSDPLGNVVAIDRISRGTNDSLLTSISTTHGWTDRFRQQLDLSVADLDGAFLSPFGTSTSETRRVTGRLQNDFTLDPRVGLTAGGDVLTERATSTFITGGTTAPVPVRRRVVGVFGETRLSPSVRTLIVAGVRFDHIQRSSLPGDPSAFAPRPDFATDTTVSVNPKLAVSYLVRPASADGGNWTRLRLSAGTGIRPPDAFEIAFTDNPSLAPERNRSLDVGIEQAVAGGAVILDATAFYNRYDDLIVAVGRSFADASRFRTDNIANARTRGLELQATVRTPWGLESRIAYTYLDADVLAVDGSANAPAPFEAGDPLLRRPRHQGTLDLLLTRGRLTVHGLVQARGDVRDVEPSFGAFGGIFASAGYATTELGGQLRIHRRAEVFVRMTNAFDRSYEEAFGFPALGRTVTTGLRFAPGR